MKRSVAMLVLVLAILISVFPVAAAETTPLADFRYTRMEDSVVLNQYIGSDKKVTVPAAYEIDGNELTVVLASETVFIGNEKITSVTLLPGVSFQDNSMSKLFAKCSRLSSVKLNGVDTSAVTDMSYLFFKCPVLESLNLTGLDTASVTTMMAMFSGCEKLAAIHGMESWNTKSLKSIYYMFNQTYKLKMVDMSRWTLEQLENSGWCFQNSGVAKLLLPEDLAVMSAGFLNHATKYEGSSFTVPGGVKRIGYAHTLYNFATADLTEFCVDQRNTAYKAVDGILYSADGKEMLAIPRGKTFPDKTYTIPEGVTFLGELSFSRNDNIRTVVLPDSYVLRYVPINDPAYILTDDTGNLNEGLNLNIAIYCYTGITDYRVKETNPNYQSVDGLIYSKDGTALVAVPTRYQQKLQIPEGVTTWNAAAMWDAGEQIDSYMKKCPGVDIPASMTRIAPDQLEKLNRLQRRYSGFKITVSDENPAYYLGESGQLLERPNMVDLEMTLSQTEFTYDGQAKEPEVLLSSGGNMLQAGTDYTVSYRDNLNAGTAWVRVTGQGEYYGTVEQSFSIAKARPEFTVPGELTAVYGQTLKMLPLPEGFAWSEPETKLETGSSQSFSAVYVTEEPNYIRSTDVQILVSVSPRQIKDNDLQVAVWYPWTGRAITPKISIADEVGVIPEEEYTVTYENNVGIGKAGITVQNRPDSNYRICAYTEFYIVPGPGLCIVVLTALWFVTTGVILKKTARSEKQQKNR